MLPVYLRKEIRGPRFITRVKHIEGDIWAFHDELKKYLESLANKEVLSQVHELGSYVGYKGAFVEEPAGSGSTRLGLKVNELESNGDGDDGHEREYQCPYRNGREPANPSRGFRSRSGLNRDPIVPA
ncbi:hypothetical protein MRX96_056216 [Rhipicephalus microplus]